MNRLTSSLRIVKNAVVRSFIAWMRSQESVELFQRQINGATGERGSNGLRHFY
jgi:hypothetical protein